MKTIFGIFLKFFASFTLAFAVLHLIMRQFFPVYIKGHIWPPLNWVIVRDIATGFMIALVLTLIHVWFVRRLAKGDPVHYGVRQMLETETAQPLHALFEDLKNQLSLYRWKIVQQDENKGVLQCRTPISWLSWGEIVRIELRPYEEQLTKIKVQSRPWGRFTLIDCGKNQRNIQTVLQVLSH